MKSKATRTLVPRPAATLILLRDSAGEPEVLMLQRARTAVFFGGAYVFPGGALDPEDHAARMLSRVHGLSDADASAKLGIGHGGLAYWVAAIRECFEEAGILLACDAKGRPIGPGRANALLTYRQHSFPDLIEREDLYLPASALSYYAHWITAPGRPRRFDTRFFVARAPEGQTGSHDAAETVHDVWITPRLAIERGSRGEIELAYATSYTLGDLARFDSTTSALDYVGKLKDIETNQTCWAKGRDGPKVFRRADPQYFEIHWSDPEGSGETTYDLISGEPKRLDRWVTRLIAPNPGVMTGPGTNTYLVGGAELAVIDPGPAIDAHVERILQFENIRSIFCTHTHMDHSPAAAAIKAATGAQIFGRPAPAGQDATFQPDVVVENGQRVSIGEISLRAIHTPGHASNHVCYLLEQTRMLFTGDHVMQGSTVVINPPDGDMRAYLVSLEKLLAEEIAVLAPGHGYLIGDPRKEIRRLIEHRLRREKKVIAALEALGCPTLEDLLAVVYDDVPPRIHAVAARSLAAHLHKLVADGLVQTQVGRYTLAAS